MYDELVKRLKDAAKMSEAIAVLLPHSEGNATAKLYNEAADAIEELSKLNAEITKRELKLRMSKPRWIPVTERLPKEKEIYWCYTNMGIMCECRWTNNIWGLGESDKWGWNIMDVPQYQKVTHWMPLPTPPKEEQT